MSTFLSCQKNHPYRPVDWRWERSKYLRELGITKVSRKYDDSYVMKAKQFQEDLASCGNELDRYTLLEKDEDLYYAYELWDSSDYENGNKKWEVNPARYEIEARILAGESFEFIAQKICTTSKAIKWYERLFFNVNDRLLNTGYVLNQVLGVSVHRDLGTRDFALIWKLLGYFSGSVVLDSYITGFISDDKPTKRENVEEYFKDMARSTLSVKAAISAKTVPVNSYTQCQILEMYSRFKEVEATVDPAQVKNTMLANIGIMMGQIPFAVGRDPNEAMNTTTVQYLTTGSTEPRAHELLQLTAEGKEMPDLSGYIYPEDARREAI